MSKAAGAVFVTGGSSGLGAAIARHYASAGWRVAIVGRDAKRLREVATDVGERCSDMQICCLDVRNSEALREAIGAFAPTAVVCCAAILGRSEVCDTLTPELFREVQDINVGGTLNACRAAMRLWHQTKTAGDIVNVSSLAGIRGLQKFSGFAAYAASKHAVIGLTEALALEGRGFDIRVNAIAPGAMLTPMSLSLDLAPTTRPEAIVPTIDFLLDRAKSGVLTGTTIEIYCNEP